MTEKSLDTALNQVQGVELKDLRSQIQAAQPFLDGLPSLNLLLRTIETMIAHVENDVRQDVEREKKEKEEQKQIEVKVVQKQIEEAKIQQAHKAVSDYRAENSQLITMVTSKNRYETQQDADNAGKMLAGYFQLIEKNPELKKNPEPQMVKEILIIGAATEETLAGVSEPQPLAQIPTVAPVENVSQFTPTPPTEASNPVTKSVPVPSAPNHNSPVNLSHSFSRDVFNASNEEKTHRPRPKMDDNCIAAMNVKIVVFGNLSTEQLRKMNPEEFKDRKFTLTINGETKEYNITEIGDKNVQKGLAKLREAIEEAKEKEKKGNNDKDDDKKSLNPVSLPTREDKDKPKDSKKTQEK